jgi:hypothetical protein
MILLIGIKINFTKNPTNPITTNPIAVRDATFVNSTKKNQAFKNPWFFYYNIPIKKLKKQKKPFWSGLWQRLTSRTLSLANSLRGSTTESMASIFVEDWMGDRETLGRLNWDFFFFFFTESVYYKSSWRLRHVFMTSVMGKKETLPRSKLESKIYFYFYLFILLDWSKPWIILTKILLGQYHSFF